MTLIRFTTFLVFLGSCTLTAQEFADAPVFVTPTDDSAPNVILIIAEDFGCGDFSHTGNKAIRTPHLDALARSSMRWTNCYVHPVGALTRASIMTGRYPIRTKCVDTSFGRSLMASDEVTLAEALQGAGYTTGLFGKWGLGSNYPMRPSDQGFGTALSFRGSAINDISAPITADNTPTLLRDNHEVALKKPSMDAFFVAAEKFIKKSTDIDRPFFVTIAADSPRAPFGDIPLEWKATTDRDLSSLGENANQIAACIEHFDQRIGLIINLLKSEKQLDNTIIIFMSDNGVGSVRPNLGLRGQKDSVYEGGVRSPLWIHWPNSIKAHDTEVLSPVAAIDIMPTVLDACGLGVPEAFAMDGISLLSQLKDPSVVLKSRPIVAQWHRGATPVQRHHFMIRDGDWKLLNASDAFSPRLTKNDYQLYHLADDPGEQRNLASEQPEQVERLQKLYDEWFKDVNETRIRDRGTASILIDRAHENPSLLTWHERLAIDHGFEIQGLWKLNFEHNGRFDILLEMPPSFKQDLTGWKAVLKLGRNDLELTQPVVGGARLTAFTSVDIKMGKTSLRAEFISPDGQKIISAYQVRIIHR